jgi:hypothetical protein
LVDSIKLILETPIITTRKARFHLAAKSHPETTRIRYLLGLCSPAEREQIEAQYFGDDDAFQKMLTTEDDLIDAYVRDELSVEERQSFEENFLTSPQVRDRIQFAHAFADTSGTRSLASEPRDTSAGFLNSVRVSPKALRVATIFAVIVWVAVISWLLVERRKMSNELRELRANYTELGKQTESLNRVAKTESSETPVKLIKPAASPKEVARLRSRGEPKQESQDATLGNTFPTRSVAQLPLASGKQANLLTLTPATTFVFLLPPRGARVSGGTTITLPSTANVIRFRLQLDKAGQHREYSAVVETADRHRVTMVNWGEPSSTVYSNTDTPAISTLYFPTGNYLLLLTGKEPDGSFVRVAEYSFRILRK